MAILATKQQNLQMKYYELDHCYVCKIILYYIQVIQQNVTIEFDKKCLADLICLYNWWPIPILIVEKNWYLQK